MIFTKVDALVKDIDVDKYHSLRAVILSSDDLNKKIIRVKSDHEMNLVFVLIRDKNYTKMDLPFLSMITMSYSYWCWSHRI